MIKRTLILIKPDGVKRGLTGEVIKRFERVGLRIAGIKMIQVSQTLAEKHYTYEDIAVKHGEEVRNRLIRFITETPVIAFVAEGDNAVEIGRKLCGTTEPRKSLPGTIRGDFAHHSYELCKDLSISVMNVVHSSATNDDAKREIALWFEDNEIFDYKKDDSIHHFGD